MEKVRKVHSFIEVKITIEIIVDLDFDDDLDFDSISANLFGFVILFTYKRFLC